MLYLINLYLKSGKFSFILSIGYKFDLKLPFDTIIKTILNPPSDESSSVPKIDDKISDKIDLRSKIIEKILISNSTTTTSNQLNQSFRSRGSTSSFIVDIFTLLKDDGFGCFKKIKNFRGLIFFLNFNFNSAHKMKLLLSLTNTTFPI